MFTRQAHWGKDSLAQEDQRIARARPSGGIGMFGRRALRE
jgi:hypothetical protein